MVLVEGAQLLAKQIPGARLTVLPECGHQLFTHQPEAGSRTVREFLGGVDSASDWNKQVEF
jgi:pimeloyl-ACP methyl ester carboxylesterase